jgi:diaminopimelate decarboxylase
MFSAPADPILYANGQLMIDGLSATDLAARFGTPVYVYAGSLVLHQLSRFQSAFAPLSPTICFALKSCSNIHIVRALGAAGAGADIVSGGELYRALAAGIDPAKIVYAGVGKTVPEVRAAIDAGIALFNIESESEIPVLTAEADRAQKIVRAAVRVNPDVNVEKTHAKTATGKKASKFGVDWDRVVGLFQSERANPWLKLTGLHVHIGSPIYHSSAFVDAIRRVLELVAEIEKAGGRIETLDIGGGYTGNLVETDDFPTIEQHAAVIVPELQDFVAKGGKIILEPGRSIISHAGVLLTEVQYVKTGGHKNFAITDTGMNHLIRPTLYEADHVIWPARVEAGFVPETRTPKQSLPGLKTYDVVGPVCESGDYLAKSRALPPLQRGDLLAIFEAGAYGMAMSSHYNTLPRPPEVWVENGTAKLIRRRETYADLVAAEILD